MEKASKDITAKTCQANVGLMMWSISEPELVQKLKKRGPVYLSFYAWAYYCLCIGKTGLDERTAFDHFAAIFLSDEGSQEEDRLTMTGATFAEATELVKSSPRLGEFLWDRVKQDFQGTHKDFHSTLKRAFDIEVDEQGGDFRAVDQENLHTLSCPFCTINVTIPDIVEKSAFRCPHCNQVFNVRP